MGLESQRFEPIFFALELSDIRIPADGVFAARGRTHRVEPSFKLWRIKAVVLLQEQRWPSPGRLLGILQETLRACDLARENQTKAAAVPEYRGRPLSHQGFWGSLR